MRRHNLFTRRGQFRFLNNSRADRIAGIAAIPPRTQAAEKSDGSHGSERVCAGTVTACPGGLRRVGRNSNNLRGRGGHPNRLARINMIRKCGDR